jgi:hypothetical protein
MEGGCLDISTPGRHDDLATPKVPIASRVFCGAPAGVSRFAGVSVCGPWNPWQSAFCSPAVLQVRRFYTVKNTNFEKSFLVVFTNGYIDILEIHMAGIKMAMTWLLSDVSSMDSGDGGATP